MPTQADVADLIDSFFNVVDDQDKSHFTDTDLVDVTLKDGNLHRALRVTHNLNTQTYAFAVKDEIGKFIDIADEPIDDNECWLVIDDHITGTWTYYIIGGNI